MSDLSLKDELKAVDIKGFEDARLAVKRVIDAVGTEGSQKHSIGELQFLYELAIGYWDSRQESWRGGNIVQTGIWRGASLCMLGLASQSRNDGYRVIGVDAYGGVNQGNDGWEYEHEEAMAAARTVVNSLGLAKEVMMVVYDSVRFGHFLQPGFRARMIFIDSLHTARYVRWEIGAYEPYLLDGGWLVFHDVFHTKLPEYSAEIEDWIRLNRSNYRVLRYRKYREDSALGHIPMSIVACQRR